jgi:hypothetical protein
MENKKKSEPARPNAKHSQIAFHLSINNIKKKLMKKNKNSWLNLRKDADEVLSARVSRAIRKPRASPSFSTKKLPSNMREMGKWFPSRWTRLTFSRVTTDTFFSFRASYPPLPWFCSLYQRVIDTELVWMLKGILFEWTVLKGQMPAFIPLERLILDHLTATLTSIVEKMTETKLLEILQSPKLYVINY